MVEAGKVYLVGAGPGDPGLLTRRGAEILAGADVVVHDHLSSDRLLDLAPPSARRVFAGKARGKCPVPQEEINELLVDQARRGRVVVRLKGGDPYIFGRGAEEAEHLKAHGVAFEVVPGVTAATGVTAYAGIPLTHREVNSAVAFVTGHSNPEEEPSRLDWPALARFPGSLVFYMGYRHHAAICRRLVAGGMTESMPAALVQSGTMAAQRVVVGTLGDLAEKVASAGMGSPALLIVGKGVDRRPTLSWFEKRPLFGRRIVITRPEGEADRSAAVLEALGAEVLVAPTVEIRPVAETGTLDSLIDRIETFDWIVFTSGNGVRHFVNRLEVVGRDLRALGNTKIAAIGPATAEALAAYRLKADLVPSSYRSEALAEALVPVVAGRRVLLARANRGREILREVLGKVAEVEQVAVYGNVDAETLPEAVARRLDAGTVDWITLTSPAIAERLYGLTSAEGRGRIVRGEIRLASLSPVTSSAIRRIGWEPAAEAEEYNWAGLVQAILRKEGS